MPKPTGNKPQRSCIACRHKGDAEGFFRLARGAEGELGLFDAKASRGRSAYVCRQEICIEGTMAKGRLGRALHGSVTWEEQVRVRDLMQCRLK